MPKIISAIIIYIFLASLFPYQLVYAANVEFINIGDNLFIKAVLKETNAWSESYFLEIVYKKSVNSKKKNLVIDELKDINNPIITQTNYIQCSGLPDFDQGSWVLLCGVRVGADFFCDSKYKLESESDNKTTSYHLSITSQRCYDLEEKNVKEWNKVEKK